MRDEKVKQMFKAEWKKMNVAKVYYNYFTRVWIML